MARQRTAWLIALALSLAVGVGAVAGAASTERENPRARSAAASTGPDLVVSSGSVRRSSGRLRGRVTVRNRGNRRARTTTGALGVRLEGSTRSREAGRFKVTGLRAGRSDALRVSMKIPGGLPRGRHRVVVCADVRRRVRERLESNNCRAFGSLTIVAPPPPPPVPPPAPVAPPAPVPPPPASTIDAQAPDPGAFPSRLRASGRSIVDQNGSVLPTLKGFNMHVEPGFTWEQAHFDAIAALGGRINRAVIHWDDFEPSQGAVSAAAIANLDLHIARAQAAGIYTLLELHLNVSRSPGWTTAHPTEMEKYSAYGSVLTQYLADRYGDATSPAYTKAVIGFGLNEPPLEDNAIRGGTGSIPYLEVKQRQMISWLRAPGHAPDWIGFVAVGYAGATPIYDPLVHTAGAVDASPTAYDAVGANVVYDVHDYMMGCEIVSADPADHTLSTDPNCDGRQKNGMNHPTYQDGPQIITDNLGHSYVSTPARFGQLTAYIKPYKTFSSQASIPLMLGEWGWADGMIGEQAWITDKKAVWADAGTRIEIHWNYDIAPTKWAARPGGTWRPSVTTWMAP